MTTDSTSTEGHTHWPVIAAQAADGKLGSDTVVIDVGDVIGITEFFVITSGNNARQVKAIVQEVEFRVREAGGPSARRVEGLESAEWVLIDFGDFVVHVFGADARGFYKLDKLWGDRPRIEWEPAGTPE